VRRINMPEACTRLTGNTIHKMHFMALQNDFQNLTIDFKGKTLGNRSKSMK
jgi:hypothetical protein